MESPRHVPDWRQRVAFLGSGPRLSLNWMNNETERMYGQLLWWEFNPVWGGQPFITFERVDQSVICLSKYGSQCGGQDWQY